MRQTLSSLGNAHLALDAVYPQRGEHPDAFHGFSQNRSVNRSAGDSMKPIVTEA
jgi:hypothetical protein